MSARKSGSKTMQSTNPRQEAVCDLPVINLTSTQAWTSAPDRTIPDIVEEMDQHNVNCVIIVQNKKPVGIVTLRDLLKLLIRSGNF